MLSDEQRGELYEFFRAQLAVVTIADHVESMIAQARADERERWRPLVEDMRANMSCETMHHRRAVQHGISGPCLALRELDEKIAKIRARKDGQ